MASLIRSFRKALWLALEHDVLNTAKAVAYSGMLALFPALVVLTALLAQVPEGTSLVGEVRAAFEQLLPGDSMSLLRSAMETRRLHSAQLIFSAAGLSVFAGLGMMLSLMEGFRRAYRLPLDNWGFGQRRLRALLLVPIVLVPLSLATLVLVFGRQIEAWMIDNAGHELRHFVLFFWRMVALGHCARHQHQRPRRLVPLRHPAQGALGLGGPRRRGRHAGLVPGHAGLWLVRHANRRLLDVLRLLWRRHRHAGLALHHLIQRAAGRGTEWRPLS